MLHQLRLLVVLVSVSIVFVGCSPHSYQYDGPPPYDVDVSQIADATPKAEPLSRYGNLDYSVRGRRYHVLKSARNYSETGVASWYGTKFHKHKTSSGEPYNMLAMTAAHRSLPLPSYVRVTNLKNHRSVIVKVNDRGPFEKNRLIDLSYAAAKKLGVLAHGTTKVKVEVITPSQAKPSIHHRPGCNYQPPAFADSGLYLQVGVFNDHLKAQKVLEKAKAHRWLDVPVGIKTIVHNDRKLYRVEVGPIGNEQQRHHLYQRLKGLGIGPIANLNH